MKLTLTALTALCLAAVAAAFWRTEPATARAGGSFKTVRAAVLAAETVECSVRRHVLRDGFDAPDRRDRLYEGRFVADGTRRRTDLSEVLVTPGLPERWERRPAYRSLRSTEVADDAAGTVLRVDHRARRATVGPLAGDPRAAEVLPAVFAFFRDPPVGDADPLPAEAAGEIDGVTMPCFQFKEFPLLSGRGVVAHLFVDPDTNLPALLVVQRPAYGRELVPGEPAERGDGERWTFSDFRFGHAVPDAEFQPAVPPGYEFVVRRATDAGGPAAGGPAAGGEAGRAADEAGAGAR